MKTDWARLMGCIVVSEAAGLIGSVATINSIPTWYAALIKPAFAPPNWVFAPVWTLLYALMGVAAYLVLQQGWHKPAVRKAVTAFGSQLGLNVLWSFLFFGLHSPLLALFGIALLWFAIAWTIREFHAVCKPAAWLLVPYLAWVSFAALLNFAIWQLNP